MFEVCEQKKNKIHRDLLLSKKGETWTLLAKFITPPNFLYK